MSYTRPSIYMHGFTLNVLLSISSIWVFLFLTLEFLKLQNTPQMPCSNNLKIWNVFLSQDTQKGVFTVTTKDPNSGSTTAGMDYHGTGFSLMQMHSEESIDTVYDYIYTMGNAIDSLKIDSPREDYSQISTFLSDLAVYYTPKCNDSMEIPSLNSSILSKKLNGWI